MQKRLLTAGLVLCCVFEVNDLRCGMNPSLRPLRSTNRESDVCIFFSLDVELPGWQHDSVGCDMTESPTMCGRSSQKI